MADEESLSPRVTSPRTPSSAPPLSSSPRRRDDFPSGTDPLSQDPFDDDVPEDEDDGEDLLGEDLERDYQQIRELDTYDIAELDQREYGALTADQREAADREISRRQREQARREGRLPSLLDEDDEEAARPSRRRRVAERAAMGDEVGDSEGDIINLEEDIKGPLKDYLQLDGPRREIARRFRLFLTSFTDKRGNSVYAERIKNMCTEYKQSLEVSYLHLSHPAPILAIWVADAPKQMLEIFDEVAMDVVLASFPEYERVFNDIHVRITDLPISDSLRDLRELKFVKYDCLKCGFIMGPFFQNTQTEIKVGSCPECQSKGPFALNADQTIYRNYQKLTLQEAPGSVPAGRLPRHKEVVLLGDLIDSARPGEEVEVTGVYANNFDRSLNNRHGFPVFETVIEANNVVKKEDEYAAFRLTEEDIREIQKLAKDPRIGERIVNSMAPSIFGHSDIKTAIALSLFGGQRKNLGNKHRIRGDINVLVVGDPGTAKSQFLKYVEKTASRAVYTTGKGASAVGLTASVQKDPITREWVLEGGALVLADNGFCLIDEFDKMNDQDRTSIHEAMEQQTISISKAGIVATLQARCAVVAAANPVGGRYNPSKTFQENVELTDPIISRFDVVCVVRDTVDPVEDERLANFVVGSHISSHPRSEGAELNGSAMNDSADDGSEAEEKIPQELLRKYIMYARHNVNPKISNMNQEKIAQLYAELRRESQSSGGIPVAVRHIESMIRIAESHARMHLREYVREDDVDVAIRVMLESFLACQKYSVQRSLRRKFSRFLLYKRDTNQLLGFILQQMIEEQIRYEQIKTGNAVRPEDVKVTVDELEMRAREVDIHNVYSFFETARFKNLFVQEGNTIAKRG